MPPRARPSVATQVPVYQPPTNALTPSAQNALTSLRRTHQLTGVEGHLKEANSLLADCVYDASKMLADREAALDKHRAKAERDGVEVDAQEQLRQEQRRNVVEKLTGDMDLRTRKTIDEQYAVQFMKDGLDAAAASSALPVSQALSFDPTMPDAATLPDTGPLPPSDKFRKRARAQMDEWQQLELAARYSQHPDYIAFKSQLHTGAHGDDAVIPPASRWFATAHGSPAPGTARGPAAGDSDDDLVVAREVHSTKCPVTLTELVDPIMSRLCRHTYEKAAIMQMIGHRGEIECPATGCYKRISQASLHVDQARLKMIRRIQRSKTATQRANDDSDDDDRPADGRNANKSILLDGEEGDNDFDTLIDDEQVSSTAKAEPKSSRAFPSSRPNQAIDLEGNDNDDNDVDDNDESEDEDDDDEPMED